jgi:hypothetical protein
VKAANTSPNGQLIEDTREVWKSRLGREVTSDEAKEIVANVTGFFSVLAEWSRAEASDQTEHSAENSTSKEEEARDDR